MSTAVLREPRWQDIEALVALERRIFPHDAWSAAAWWSELAARPRKAYRLLVDAASAPDVPGACIIGYAGLDLVPPVADVMTVAVDSSARGQGYGRILLDWLAEAAAEAGATDLMLEVRADNAAALRMYRAAGFAVISTRRRYYQPDDVDALAMRAPLQPITRCRDQVSR